MKEENDIAARFMEHLSKLGYGDSTAYSYANLIRKFLDRDIDDGKEDEKITISLLRDWLEKNISMSQRAQFNAAWNLFVDAVGVLGIEIALPKIERKARFKRGGNASGNAEVDDASTTTSLSPEEIDEREAYENYLRAVIFIMKEIGLTPNQITTAKVHNLAICNFADTRKRFDEETARFYNHRWAVNYHIIKDKWWSFDGLRAKYEDNDFDVFMALAWVIGYAHPWLFKLPKKHWYKQSAFMQFGGVLQIGQLHGDDLLFPRERGSNKRFTPKQLTGLLQKFENEPGIGEVFDFNNFIEGEHEQKEEGSEEGQSKGESTKNSASSNVQG